MTFRKGESGNPNGAPRKANSAARLARAHAEKAIKVLVDALDDPKVEIKINAAEKLLNRGFGMPKEFHELTGEDGGPIEIRKLPATDSWIAGLLGNGEEASPPASKPH